MSEVLQDVAVADAAFKSTLPPRKRAKTKEEKEQRRVERILRNRRAAHASREKKRKHVEYLESYVVQLESNLTSLQENFDKVHILLTSAQASSLDLAILKDVQELKEKIHSNLTASAKRGENDEDDEDNDEDEDFANTQPVASKKRKLSVDESTTSSTVSSPSNNNNITVKEEKTYYSYLSPVSINSPINSPLDLTLSNSNSTKESSRSVSEDLESKPTTIKQEPTDIVYDSMGQNSAAILSTHMDFIMGRKEVLA